MRSFFTILMAAVILCGCTKQSLVVKDTTKPATLTLTTKPRQKGMVHGLGVSVKGQIDGSALISGTTIQTQRVTGTFDIQFNGDYFQTNFTLWYSPEAVRSGRFTVEYQFRELH